MTAVIKQLIDTPDTSEVIRDKIAASLAEEITNQKALAEAVPEPDLFPWSARVYLERTNPWGVFERVTDDTEALDPVVNVALDRVDYAAGAGGVVNDQVAEATFNLDIYSVGVAQADGAGHLAGDEQAAVNAQVIKRLVRQILMSGYYTYLNLPRGIIWKRWLRSEESFLPPYDERAAQHVRAVRLVFTTKFSEASPQVIGEILEQINLTVTRAEDGRVLFNAEYR